MVLGIVKFEVNIVIFFDIVFHEKQDLFIMSILDVNSKFELGF